MDQVEMRECVSMFRDTLRLLEAGKPIPLDFLKKQVSQWEDKINQKEPSRRPPDETI